MRTRLKDSSARPGNLPPDTAAYTVREADIVYPLTPLKVFAHESIKDDPLSRARMERIIGGTRPVDDELVWVDNSNMPEVVEELKSLWPPDEVPEGFERTHMRPLVFTRVYTDGEFPELNKELLGWPDGTDEATVRSILGHFLPIQAFHPYERDGREDMVCWPTFDFGLMTNCPHGCHYCGAGKHGKYLTIACNAEEHMEKVVRPAMERYPWQRCFRMIGWGAEMLAFEPEAGIFDLFTKTLAEQDRYGYFHAASSNVDWIENLERKDRLVGIFSVTTEMIAEVLEPGSGHAFDRFEAGRKLGEMGVPFRYKFKPTIPVVNWREEYSRAIERALTVSQPESVGFCVIMWNTVESLLDKIDEELLDPVYLQAARDASEQMAGVRVGPYPHEIRKEMYQYLFREVRKHSDDVKLYMSTESRAMWDDIGAETGQDPNAFFCGCSSVALPGGKLSLSKGCPYSTFRALEHIEKG